MKKYLSLLLVTVSALLLSACTATPNPALVAATQIADHKPTSHEAKIYCENKGGHYETWKDEDGTSNVFCILPQGYGCDPIKFADGSCGMN